MVTYESIDVGTRLFFLELLRGWWWEWPCYFPKHLVFLGTSFLVPILALAGAAHVAFLYDPLTLVVDNGDDKDENYGKIKSMLDDPDIEACSGFTFDIPDGRGLPRPASLYDPDELQIVAEGAKSFREKGFCPLHRHPQFVEYIESLHSLLEGEYLRCIRAVDFSAAKGNAIIASTSTSKPEHTNIDEVYSTHVLEPAIALKNGFCPDSRDSDTDYEPPVNKSWFLECKGISVYVKLMTPRVSLELFTFSYASSRGGANFGISDTSACHSRLSPK
jgi:hypothetical protein